MCGVPIGDFACGSATDLASLSRAITAGRPPPRVSALRLLLLVEEDMAGGDVRSRLTDDWAGWLGAAVAVVLPPVLLLRSASRSRPVPAAAGNSHARCDSDVGKINDLEIGCSEPHCCSPHRCLLVGTR